MDNQYKFYQFQQIPTPNFNEAMMDLAEQFENQIKENIAKPYPYARGYKRLAQQTGIRDLTKKTGRLYNSVEVSYSPLTRAITIRMVDYWKYVNDGRQPGTYVPLKPLIDWIKIKGLNRDPRGRFKAGSLKGLAARISKSIFKKGIEPTNFYDDSFDLLVQEFTAPDGPGAQFGLDVQTFIRQFLRQPD